MVTFIKYFYNQNAKKKKYFFLCTLRNWLILQMLIQVSDLHLAYQQIVQSSLSSELPASVLIFVPLTVDSLAASSILYELFRKDNILNHFVPVRGYTDLTNQIQERLADETLPPSIIFINCGGSISLLRRFPDAFKVSTAYIIDSHRPIDFENLDSRVEKIKVFDDSQSMFDEICSFPDSQLSEEESIVIEGKQKNKNMIRTVRKIIDPNSDSSTQYMNSTYFSDPASLQLYTLASSINHTSLTILWFAILGLTEHFLLEHIDNVRYESLFNALQNEASRLTDGKELFTTIPLEEGEFVTPVNSITVPVSRDLFIQPCTDLRCNLMRHWTLYESMQSSPFIVSRLQLWYHAGLERMNLLLVKMGIPLREAKTTFISMSSDIRETIVTRFDKWCDRFGLTGIDFPSFILKRGFAAPLTASDIVYAVRARLLAGTDFGEAFSDSFSIIRLVSNHGLLSADIDAAKSRSKLVVSLGMELMNKKNASVITSHAFRIAYVYNAAERGFPVVPSSLVELGQFLLQAFREEDDKVLPMVVAAMNPDLKNWTLVAVSTGFEFGEVESSRFGAYFKGAAEKAEIEITMDSFDSFVCQIPADLILVFIDQLTLLALKD